MSSSTYETLLLETKLIVSKYSLDTMLKGFTPSLLNILLQNHIEKLKDASDYEKTVLLINNALKSQFGASVSLDDFITLDSDRYKLYSLLSQWRFKLLADLQIQI